METKKLSYNNTEFYPKVKEEDLLKTNVLEFEGFKKTLFSVKPKKTNPGEQFYVENVSDTPISFVPFNVMDGTIYNGFLISKDTPNNWIEYPFSGNVFSFDFMSNPDITIEPGQRMYIKNVGNTPEVSALQQDCVPTISFKNKERNALFNVGGDITTLYASFNPENFCYSCLFCSDGYSISGGVVDASKLILPKIVCKGCYLYMFALAWYLKKAPILPAEELAARCYEMMFMYNTHLSEVTVKAKSWIPQQKWLYGVGSSGIIKKPASTYIPDFQIPEGWVTEDI